MHVNHRGFEVKYLGLKRGDGVEDAVFGGVWIGVTQN